MSRYIKFDDAVKIMACEMYAEAQSQGYEVDSIEDFMPEAKSWMNDAPSADRPSAVDLSSVYSTAYKSGYEKGKADRPQGEWIVNMINYESLCSVCGAKETAFIYGTEMWYGLGKSKFCPSCGARMKGADDEDN